MNTEAAIRNVARELSKRRDQVIEAAFEKALVAGVGVAVVEDSGIDKPIQHTDSSSTSIRVEGTISVGPHPAVPAGEILYFPTRAAFDLYVEQRDRDLGLYYRKS